MLPLKDLVALGKEFGYAGKSLRKRIQEDQSQEWDERGKALDVYSRLSRDDVFKYDVLKESLPKRYELTEQSGCTE
ncbi:hypothetical protein CHS0354_005546 [Potamilus streckersoni]|uniref:Uncharacterized protein n=1 Tax=Potamilus streckersoni TaxID=2493646 RepID=A0AAE0RNI4_9BIVA|nr:hypothetical protein CHS0354_005546 [Potamilus streckersoni]